MNHKRKILLVGTLFLAVALLLGVFAFLVSTGSFSIDSFHTGTTGEKGSTASYTFRSTSTFQQPGNKQTTTSSYSANLGWLSLGSLKIISTTISPYAVINGSNVSLYITASNSENVWAAITKPDTSQENITLANNVNTNFTNTSLTGRYNVTFYANDSSGETINNTPDFFESFEGVVFNFTIIDFNTSGVNSTWELFYRDVIIKSNETNSSEHDLTSPDTLVDLKLKSHVDRLQITLQDINVSLESGKQFGMDKHNQESGFLVTYGINNSYAFTNATVRILYDDIIGSVSNEANLKLFKCDNYNFVGRTCLGIYTDITSSATQNTGSDFFEYVTTTFSGFSIKEVTPSTTPSTESSSTGGGAGCMVGYRFDTSIRKCVKIEGEVEEGIPSQLFDITLSLDDSIIESSEELSAVVTFESFGTVPTQVNLTFIILDESGTEYAVDKDFIVVITEEVFRKKFKALYLPEGKYILVLQTLYNIDVFDEFRQEFEIREQRRGITGNIIGWVEGNGKWYLTAAAGIILIVILIRFMIKKIKRKS